MTLTPGSKYASNVTLIERNRCRGWIAIIREGKGFIEQSNITDNIVPIAFTNDTIPIDLGDEVEFNLKTQSGQLTAENISKVPSTVQNFYVRIYIYISLVLKRFFLCLISRFYQLFIVVELYHLFE